MEEIVVSPPISFLFLLLYLSCVQEAIVSSPIGTGCFHKSKFSVKHIFTHNHNWDRYHYFRRETIRKVEKREVEKMMSCKGPDRGCRLYYCPKCEEYHEISLGRNSRLCSDCGKRYTDQWAKTLSSKVEILEKDIPSEISLSESKEIAIVVANNRGENVVGGDCCISADGNGTPCSQTNAQGLTCTE